MAVRRLDSATARRQAPWIAAMPPWRGLGYRTAGLGAWLGRVAARGWAWGAIEGARVAGIVVIQPDVLLGDFVALLAVRPDAAGRGIGRRLMARAELRCFRRRRWLYVSSDGRNRAAAALYARLGFSRVARLPDLVRAGRVEILWRKGASRA